ncbi:C1QL [Mytilus edulis]|uniref:C1QL n=1 Tax=Mytilus edulis TaxID=6550 RepID=A0A8S3T765_MYTED|nr:C1QL [Mytilus edulis]
MKQKLDTTFEDNNLLKERVDIQSKDIKEVLETNAHLEERLDTVFEENRYLKNILITFLEDRDTDVHVPNNNEQNENEIGVSTSVSEPVLFSDHSKGRQAKTQNDKILPSEFQKEKRLFLQDNILTQLPAIIAFSVQLTGGHIQLGQQQTVGYNTVITNIGNAYDSGHNHFIAPIKGLYLLSFTGMNKDGPDFYLEMVKTETRLH